ncbi:MAG TPA: hypothetical protein PKY59_05835 [Pyrinomonadaceae bacterium]|nr:hypothetical protein [Pyrinomonadaceae bacterium]
MSFLHKLKDSWLWFWFGETDSIKAGKILAKHLVRIFEKCPSCNEKFGNHKIAPFAVRKYSSESVDKSKESKLYENLRQNRWAEIINKDEFDSFENALGVYVIECPNLSLYWLVLFQPSSIDDSIQLQEWSKIEKTETENLLKMISENNWSEIK